MATADGVFPGGVADAGRASRTWAKSGVAGRTSAELADARLGEGGPGGASAPGFEPSPGPWQHDAAERDRREFLVCPVMMGKKELPRGLRSGLLHYLRGHDHQGSQP